MANVLNRVTLQYITSANNTDYPEPDWIWSPDMSGVAGVSPKYWKLVGNTPQEMTQPEKDAVDAALLQAQEDSEISELNGGILKRLVLVLLDEINRARTADGVANVTIAQFKNAMRNK